MWTIFNVFIEFVTVLFLFYALFFSPRGMWDLSFLTRDRSFTPTLEGKVLTTGLLPQGSPTNKLFKRTRNVVSEIFTYCSATAEYNICRLWKFCVGMSCLFLKLDEPQAKFEV